jgi:glycosyltransferase involved in cell wall biosynthesis
MKRIALLVPWYAGSHKRWADGLKRHSSHQVDIHSLPGRHWKWRMHGAAVTLAGRVLEADVPYDLIVAEDLMDVAVFTALLRQAGVGTPVAMYFHENQISYPVSPRDTDVAQKRDLHYGFINYTSALASDTVFFNSVYHRNSFLGALPGFLDRYPDHGNKGTVGQIAAKANVLPLGLDLKELNRFQPANDSTPGVPLILWNHRWEYDKCPGIFLQLLLALQERGLAFEVALLGQRGGEEPPLLEEARSRLGTAIVQDGPVDDFATYAAWLWRADILPVTGIQDFFGGSVVEAIYAGCHPVLPRRLAYPEHVTDPGAFYATDEEAIDKVAALIESGAWRQAPAYATNVARYDWSAMIRSYDKAFDRP